MNLFKRFCPLPCLLTLVFFSSGNKASAGSYNIKDLESLEREKQYKEFLDHAFDVRPSERDKHWQEILSDMAIMYISESIKNKDFTQRHFDYIEHLMTWQGLKNDELFQAKRNEYGHKYFSSCFQSLKALQEKSADILESKEASCKKAMLKFWNDTPEKNRFHDIGIALATEGKNYLSNEEAWQFVQEGVQSNIGEIYCQKEAVLKPVFWKLDQLNLKSEEEDSDLRVTIKMTFSEECRKALLPALKNSLRSNKQTHFEMAFKVLALLNALDSKDKDLFYTIYILRGPAVGQTFNEAWNVMESFGQNFRRRLNVLSELKKFDPLPDQAFAGVDQKKTEVLLDFISRNLPEYLEYYAKTCLDYLEGKQEFPNGNPTMSCHEFFKRYNNLSYANQAIKMRYLKRRKF